MILSTIFSYINLGVYSGFASAFSDSIDMRKIKSSFIFTLFAVIFDVLELDKKYNTQPKGHFLPRKLNANGAVSELLS